MRFRDWLDTQIDRDDPIGDLARAMQDDPDWPQARMSLQGLRRYLRGGQAAEAAIEALEWAWAEWRREASPDSITTHGLEVHLVIGRELLVLSTGEYLRARQRGKALRQAEAPVNRLLDQANARGAGD